MGDLTLTTVGYGDVVPVTPLGKLLAGAIGVIGIGMVALPAGLLASGFSEQLHQRRREFEAAVDRILASGTIGPDEGDDLRAFRDRLGLSDHQAAESSGSSSTSAGPRVPALWSTAGTDRPPRATPLPSDRRRIHSPRTLIL